MRGHGHRLASRRAVRHLAAARDRDPPLPPAQEVVREAPRRLAPALHDLPRSRTHGDQRQAERRGEALLRAGHIEVHAPLVRADVDPRDRGHGVQQEERADRARDRPHFRGGVGRAGGRLVVDQRDRLRADALGLPLEARHVQARAPLHRKLGPVGLEPVHDLAHEQAELAGTDHEHAVTRLDDRERARFERRPARARHQDDLVLRLEDVAQSQCRRLEHHLVEAPVVLDRRRRIHRLDDRKRKLGGAGDHQERTRVALGPIDRQGHDRLLCIGVRGAADSRGWPEKGTSRLRWSKSDLIN